MRRYLLIWFAVLPACPAQPAVARLGEVLFRNPALSGTGKISCATCHVPHKSFTNGALSIGVLGTSVGHTPTLWAAGRAEKLPKLLQVGSPFQYPGHSLVTLEHRCLQPLRYKRGMGLPPERAVARLRDLPDWPQRFDAAFDESGPGVTEVRIGRALATYIRSLQPPRSPFHDYRDRNLENALTPQERAGYTIFHLEKCGTCHSGRDFTDGLVHEVGRSWNLTSSLWDISRTGPYLRDGSARNLGDAVRWHVEELINCKSAPISEPLHVEEVTSILLFLHTLSPRPKKR